MSFLRDRLGAADRGRRIRIVDDRCAAGAWRRDRSTAKGSPADGRGPSTTECCAPSCSTRIPPQARQSFDGPAPCARSASRGSRATNLVLERGDTRPSRHHPFVAKGLYVTSSSARGQPRDRRLFARSRRDLDRERNPHVPSKASPLPGTCRRCSARSKRSATTSSFARALGTDPQDRQDDGRRDG